MGADQRRKRLNGATIVGCSSREQLHKAKKKNVGSIQDESNINSHISLEWDGDQKAVVAKRDQIGISWRDMRPYIDSTFTSNNIPADVFVVPHGIYELENLDDVLTYEVWQTHLSENERIHLMQFLPRGPEAQQIVQALLAGDTFHFGNPFLNWGASLCSGDFHPDLILCQEQSLKTEKNVYYKELQKYHNDLIAYLLNLKERYAGCEDPEKDFLPEIWSLRNGMEKQIISHANDSRFGVLDENATLTSESCSWVADEKACSSDNQFSSVIKGGELENRFCENGFRKDKSRQSVTADDSVNVAVTSKKGDKLRKRNNIHSSNGAKYMSYVKISKKQYELIKSMKQSGKSVHCRSLNRVLGQGFNVQPYQVFVEEEQKKLHEHWLHLASQDLPAAYASWKEMRMQRRKITESLETDMRKRLTSVMEQDEGKDNHSALQDELVMENPESTMQEDEKSIPHSPPGENCNLIYMEEDVMSQPLTNGHECNFTDIDSEKHGIESDNDLEKGIITESDHYPLNVSEYLGNLNTTDAALSKGAHLCSSGDAWKAVNMPHSYYDSTVSHDYPSVSEFSVTPPPDNEEHQTQMIDLENGFHVGDMGKDMSERQSENGSFSSYPNQDRNELLQSLFKGQGMSSYPLQKQNGLDFRPPNNLFMGDGQFPVHFEEHQHQSLPMELGEMRENDDYMQQLPANISDGGGYLIPRQEHLAAVNLQDWAVNSVRMPGPPQSQFNGGDMLSQNWFSGEQPVHAGWSAPGGGSITSHSIGSGSSTDQGLFSVLSHCNQLRSGNPYHSVDSTDQFSSPRSYGMVGGVTPRVGNVLPQAAHALDYIGSRDAATSIIHDDMQWMNLSHQTSGLRDPMGKPFLRSWNQ